MRVRTANWGPLAFIGVPHALVRLQLAPADAPEIVVRILKG